jgi:hypothetical protein
MLQKWRSACSEIGRFRGKGELMLAKTLQTEQTFWPVLSGPPELEPERRGHPRLKLAISVVFFKSGETSGFEAKTEDVSCNGFYCVSRHPFSPNESLECELLIPGTAVGSIPEDDLCLRCRVRVVRVVTKGIQQEFGVACHLESYTIGRSARESVV